MTLELRGLVLGSREQRWHTPTSNENKIHQVNVSALHSGKQWKPYQLIFIGRPLASLYLFRLPISMTSFPIVSATVELKFGESRQQKSDDTAHTQLNRSLRVPGHGPFASICPDTGLYCDCMI
ncbi:unnamed protein product [Prorocentrum cordatum]|uniref:Uncharacterized protein n=1 Tax=Prorocentrum cordatum TaxID=2364126 RepID=A0ABN9X6T7_9DINO|nr:unnamed protein product [Polarella glacialis]